MHPWAKSALALSERVSCLSADSAGDGEVTGMAADSVGMVSAGSTGKVTGGTEGWDFVE